MDLEGIVEKLAARRQRATYGAVAGVLGILPRGLMAGRAKAPLFSWVVAKTSNAGTGARKGWPTGYTDGEIDPACLEQCRRDPAGFIAEADELRKWLKRS